MSVIRSLSDKENNYSVDRVKRKICLVNRSATAASFRLSSTASELALQDRGVFNIAPGYGEELTILPAKSVEIELSFSPKSRIPRFRSEINLECMGCSKPLLAVTGTDQQNVYFLFIFINYKISNFEIFPLNQSIHN